MKNCPACRELIYWMVWIGYGKVWAHKIGFLQRNLTEFGYMTSFTKTGSVFVKRRQPAKKATYFSLCAGYFDRLVHRLYYIAVNLASFLAMSSGYYILREIPDRPLDKTVYLKIIYLIFEAKHMLWVLKRTGSMRRFFWAPKTDVKTDG